MTMKAHTIGCGYDIKQLYTIALRDPLGKPLGRDPLGKPLGRDPFRGDPVIELYAIETYKL